jgi:CreA protein
LVLYSCSKDQVGTVSLGLFTTKDLKIEKLNDPLIPGVICYISNIIADFSFAYPLDSSIICRQTGEITPKVQPYTKRNN